MLKPLKEVIEVKEENQVFKILAMNLPFLPPNPLSPLPSLSQHQSNSNSKSNL